MRARPKASLPAKKGVGLEKGGAVSDWLLTAPSILVTLKVVIDFVGSIYAVFVAVFFFKLLCLLSSYFCLFKNLFLKITSFIY